MFTIMIANYSDNCQHFSLVNLIINYFQRILYKLCYTFITFIGNIVYRILIERLRFFVQQEDYEWKLLKVILQFKLYKPE